MRSSWQADLVTPAAQACSETICLYAYVVVLTPPGAGHPGFTAIAALFVLAAWLGRWSQKHPRPGRADPRLLVPTSLLVPPAWLLAMLMPDGGLTSQVWAPQAWMSHAMAAWRGDAISAGEVFVLAAMVLLVWCRGLWLGATPADSVALHRGFIGGVIAFLVLFIVLAFGKGTGVERFTATLRMLVLSYFVLAPSMLALVHLETLHSRTAVRQPVSFAWIVALVAPTTLIVATGLALSFGMAPVLRGLMQATMLAWLLLWHAVVWALYWPLVALAWLANLLSATLPEAMRPGGRVHIPPPRPPPPPADLFGLPSDRLIVVLIVGAVLLGALFLWRLLRRPRVAQARHIDEERSSAWSWSLFRAQLLAAWQRLFNHFLRHRLSLSRTVASRRVEPGPAHGPADIRALYRRLLRWAASRGHPRGAATTPDELWRELAAAMPAASASVALITGYYEQTRYGGMETVGEALAASRVASESLDAVTAQPDRSA